MLCFPLAILLAVQSLLLASVAARPWFVPTKQWANSTTFLNHRRSFNYTAILEAREAREAVKRQPVRRSVDLMVDASPKVDLLTARAVNITERAPMNFTGRAVSNNTVSFSKRLSVFNATAIVERRALPETNSTTLATRATKTVASRSLSSGAVLVERSISSGTVHAARSLSSGISRAVRALPSGTMHAARSLSSATALQARGVNATTKATHVRRAVLKPNIWTNATSS